MNSLVLYIVVVILLGLSYYKDKKKTKMALKKAWKSFQKILPQFLSIIFFVGLLMGIFSPETISKLLGSSSGALGVVVAAVIGSVTLIPGFVAFPTAAILVENGAGYMQIAAFVSALMMVGVMTYPMEKKFFGKKVSIMRNLMAFAFTFIVAFVIGKVVAGL